jgi:hypothetical protein
MDEMEFTEAESNMNDLVSEYQQYQVLNRNIVSLSARFTLLGTVSDLSSEKMRYPDAGSQTSIVVDPDRVVSALFCRIRIGI